MLNSELINSFSNLEEKRTLEIVQEELKHSKNIYNIWENCKMAMEIVGKRFEKGEYFIADLMYAANIFEKVNVLVKPFLAGKKQFVGKVLIATVQDDIHDIGKNLVASMLEAYGFEVQDLGVNVPPDEICSAILQHKPDIVGLSCLLTSTIDSMETTIRVIEENDLRDKLKIIVGGHPLNQEIASEIGSDAFGKDAAEGAIKCLELLGRGGR